MWVRLLLGILLAAASTPTARPAVGAPPGLVVPPGLRPGARYDGVMIGSRGDSGVWLAEDATLTLDLPQRGTRLVLVLYEPDDGHVVEASVSGSADRAKRSIGKGVHELALALTGADRDRSRLRVRVHASPARRRGFAVVLVRLFRY
jgi:hypothetical protein